MGRRLDELPLKLALASTDLLIGHDGSAGFQITVADASSAFASGSSGGSGDTGIGSSVVTGILMECADDGSNHRLRMRLRDGVYSLGVNQDAESGDAVTSITMRCQEDDTDHLLTLRLRDGAYVLRVNQDAI